MSHSHIPGYKWLNREKTDPSVAPSCVPNVAPAAMPLPAEAREGSSGLVGDTCACQLDGDDDDRRLPCCLQ